ncbi:MAG: type II toxin-antitoxin system RelE/ParE family toxin [Pseudomonadota bacterium]|nr:type II toxin-antitoxin system RelE/ParE family toxin [Pseudomonadota bacterium]
MTLPIRASVEAAPNFLSNLETARLFLVEQDTDSADERFRKLKQELREMIDIVSWSPASGRSARFLDSRSAQARLRTASVKNLAAQAGLPNLREYVLGRYIVLYAHAEAEVVLLALKHQRQLIYCVAE